MRHHDLGDGRFVVRLDAGDDLIASLRGFAGEHDITAGLVTGLGSVDQITLGFLDPDTNEYVKRRFDERMEVANLTGTFSMFEDRPFLHLHAVVCPRELLAYGGHVHKATVGAVMELIVTAFRARLERHTVPEHDIPQVLLPDEPKPEGTASAS